MPTPSSFAEEPVAPSTIMASKDSPDEPLCTCTSAVIQLANQGLYGEKIIFHFVSTEQPVKWQAVLRIKPKRLASLMRQPFSFTSANICRGKSYFSCGPVNNEILRYWYARMWTRVYFLKDLAEDPQWVGWLEVYATDNDVAQLSQFEVSNLSVDILHCIHAGDQMCQLVYLYSKERPDYALNAYYDHMPKGGLWPCPKTDETVEEEQQPEDAHKLYDNEETSEEATETEGTDNTEDEAWEVSDEGAQTYEEWSVLENSWSARRRNRVPLVVSSTNPGYGSGAVIARSML